MLHNFKGGKVGDRGGREETGEEGRGQGEEGRRQGEEGRGQARGTHLSFN